MRLSKLLIILAIVIFAVTTLFDGQSSAGGEAFARDGALDDALTAALSEHGFTGRIQEQLERRLGRKVDRRLAELGRLLWFDTISGLNDDNSCAGCHSPTAGFGDTQSIAIGIDNNGIVGPNRAGPRNQRRTPMAINTAFYPNLMWNSRFPSLAGDPFDNGSGFSFPPPEGMSLSSLSHLLVAQAFIPPTERVEAAGFDFPGDNFDIRAEVANRLNASGQYRKLFGKMFPEVKAGGAITYEMFASAIAEFEFTLVFADAPLDRFARGEKNALSEDQKRGALLFFGAARCVECHSVTGQSNEMFSDFSQHVLAVPQVVPASGNVTFDGPGENEDFGLEQVTLDQADRYRFRTSPLRNVGLQPTFFHNGAFTKLEDAIRHHLNPAASAAAYSPTDAGLADDLTGMVGPIDPALALLDPILITPINLTYAEFCQLVDFVRNGLLDARASPENLRKLIPKRVPSGRPMLVFE